MCCLHTFFFLFSHTTNVQEPSTGTVFYAFIIFRTTLDLILYREVLPLNLNRTNTVLRLFIRFLDKYSLVNEPGIGVAIRPGFSVVGRYFVRGTDRVFSTVSEYSFDETPVFDADYRNVPQCFFANYITVPNEHVCGSY